jgi:hypothetical protein
VKSGTGGLFPLPGLGAGIAHGFDAGCMGRQRK